MLCSIFLFYFWLHKIAKIESDIEFSGRRDQVILHVFSKNKANICVKMMARHRVFFVGLFLFSYKCFKDWQEMCEFSTQRSQSPNSCGLPPFLLISKMSLLDEVIYHQVIPSFWTSSCFIIRQRYKFLPIFGTHFVGSQARFQRPCLCSWVMHALRAYSHHGLHTLRSYTLTILQPGDIVCSSLIVHYHKK